MQENRSMVRQDVRDLLQALGYMRLTPQEQLRLEIQLTEFLVETLRPEDDKLKQWFFLGISSHEFSAHLHKILGEYRLTTEIFHFLLNYYLHPNWKNRTKIKYDIEIGEKCACCDDIENMEVDHKLAVAKGGTSHKDNLQLLCRKCNKIKSDKIAFVKIIAGKHAT